MERNSPINSVYLIALAVASMFMFIDSLYTALIYSVVILVTYLISLSIVSMVDKIADNHVRFILFIFLASAIITILKVISPYINVREVVLASENLEKTIIPCLILAIYPIYFENTFMPQKYVKTIVVISFAQVLMFAVFGAIVEIFGYGSIVGIALNIPTTDFVLKSYGAFFIIATLAVLFNIVRRAYLKKTKRFDTLVEKYKIIIRDLQEEHEDVDYTTISGKGGNK